MTATAEFPYCGTIYQEPSRTPERKFGQTHAVVSAHLDKLSNLPALKMHIFDNIFSYPAEKIWRQLVRFDPVNTDKT